jgi:cobalt-zinc-cadmium efflux system outer membrane protein
MWSAGVGLNLPLYFWKRQGNQVKQAEAGLKRSEQEKQATLQEVLGELKKEYQIVSTAETLIGLYQNGILSQCRLSLESTLAGYTVGQVDFLALLDSVTVLLNHQLEYYEQLAEYQKALARIERLIGKEISDK